MRKPHVMVSGLVMALVLELGLVQAPAFGHVGNNACDGAEACADNTGGVENHACNGNRACADNTGAVGNHACNGDEACENNTGNTIGNNSCDGAEACAGNTGAVGNHACNGDHACNDNSGIIGKNSCNAANACRSNTGTIGDNRCNAPGACATACTAPSFDPIGNVAVGENAPPTLISMTNVIAGSPVAFSVTNNDNPSLVTASFNDDELTLTYAQNMEGTAHITVRLTSCDGLGSTERMFTVTVTC